MVTKKTLINKISQNEEIGLSKKKIEEVVDNFLNLISACLKCNETVQLGKFGTFDVGERKARIGMNVRTGEKQTYPATKFPRFKASKNLKEEVKLNA